MTRILLAVWALALVAPLAEAQNFSFRLEAQGQPAVVFSSCRGIASVSEVLEFRDGNGGPTVKAPGRSDYPNVVCSRPVSADNTLSDWRKHVVDGQDFRKSFTITLLDRNKSVKTWIFQKGWPAKWEITELDGAKSEGPIERVEIAVESVESQ